MRWNSVPTPEQPAATLVNITRCCKHSKVLLMMAGVIDALELSSNATPSGSDVGEYYQIL